MSERAAEKVLIDFGDNVERECLVVGSGPGGELLIRAPEGAEGYYSGPFRRITNSPGSTS